uniref:Uncharacterized protein n=1 Tax=Paramoeba aestuarina TaxID=180227 RepID=A0A7S4PNQ7_9EUKA|eukprot:CAMPEP_0201526004 /NCGR_PEP_ID=MMETSP0161_2-20130828/30267_1 /ASSEMBLY_ACC=CAM_ASM_000251 /TAXON_ID=180227 /ORGANISM="Neoparamoeba aestuarina, Strain SoJaBio B1-5/56/2" /LENGTH=118 /DNA_ID=CAMNT_0047926191 /DNA_START=69 /DNA_END=425 /DNA_ORIENTATION=-
MEEEVFLQELAKYPKVREATFQCFVEAQQDEQQDEKKETEEQTTQKTESSTPLTKEELNGPFWDSLLKSSTPTTEQQQPLLYTKFQEYYLNFVNNLSEEERQEIINNARNFEAQMDID